VAAGWDLAAGIGRGLRTWSSPARLQWAAAVLVAPATASSAWLVLTSGHVEQAGAAAAYRTYLVAAPVAVGLLWWRRRPASRFGPLLVALGFVAWAVSWEASGRALLFVLGSAAEVAFVVLSFFIVLAFPIGRLRTTVERSLVAALALAASLSWAAWALLSPAVPSRGPLDLCAGGCPENVLQVASAPRLVSALDDVVVLTTLAVAAGIVAVYVVRLRTATHPQRRALLAVAVPSLALLAAFLAYHFADRVLDAGAATVDALAWVLVAARIAFPLGFLVVLLRADLFAGRALRQLLGELAAHPSTQRWRELLARALDDPSLQVGFWQPRAGRFAGAGGEAVLAPEEGSGRLWVPVEREGRPLAALVVDEVLAEEPELLDAACAATLLAIEHGTLEGELRASRARVLEAGYAERRRIGRDLHDSAQQRLLALRVHVSLAAERVQPDERALVEDLGRQLDEALDELRTVARGLYPAMLSHYGLPEALRSVGRSAAIPVDVRDRGVGRHAEAIEQAVYFCCVEALQNAAKHAGAGASVTISLAGAGGVRFAVVDDGCGFDPADADGGAGLVNLADRISAVGGTLEIDSAPGRGTRVAGHVPG
jgi:signal transduction histidine kinase